jgi:hypothetical protein
MSKLLMKTLKADLPALAELIRSQGRGRDTVLAHITPKEAALLKKRGGSGTTNPETGLPEFEDYTFDVPDVGSETATIAQFPEYYPPSQGDVGGDYQYRFGEAPRLTKEQAVFYPGQAVRAEYADPYMQQRSAAFGETGELEGRYGGAAPTAEEFARGLASTQPQLTRGIDSYEAAAAGVSPVSPGVVTPPQAEKSILEKLGISPKDAVRLGLGATLAGGLTAQNIARTRQAGQQAQAARGEMAAIGKPYQEAGAQLTGAAQRGELTPASQQALQAAQAQMAQGVATRGGVGAAQMQTQLAGLRNLLLENQYNFGLKVAQIGDNYAMGAIKSGMEADRAIGTANQQFYGQLAQLLAPFITGASSPTPNVRTT